MGHLERLFEGTRVATLTQAGERPRYDRALKMQGDDLGRLRQESLEDATYALIVFTPGLANRFVEEIDGLLGEALDVLGMLRA